MALNTWAVSILRYGAGILTWNKNELQEMDRKTRKFYENEERYLAGSKNSVKREENGLGRYVKNNIEPLLAAVRTNRTITHKETVDPKEFKKIKEEQRKNEWAAKRMHGQFARDMEDKDKNNTWRWMKKSDLKGCSEALICSAQNSLYGLTILRTIFTKLPSHPFVGFVGQKKRLYLI